MFSRLLCIFLAVCASAATSTLALSRRAGEHEDEPSSTEMLRRLQEDSDFLDVKSAVIYFTNRAEKGDTAVIKALLGRLAALTHEDHTDTHHEEQRWGRIQFVIKALAQLVEEGDGVVIKTLLGLLTDKDMRARWSATKALAQLAKKGDKDVIKALLDSLTSETALFRSLSVEDVDGRRGVETFQSVIVQALAKISTKNNREVIAAVSGLLTHEDQPLLRASAIQALAQLSENGNYELEVIASVLGRLAHVRPGGVRIEEIIEALVQLIDGNAEKGRDNVALRNALAYLVHPTLAKGDNHNTEVP